MGNRPIIVSVLGWSNTGKTTFIEAAIRECARRGLPAAAIKKSRHAADLPPDAKDSSRFRAAGASPSVYLNESEMVLLSAPPPALDAETIAALCPQAAIIFCEGLEAPGAILVLMAGESGSEEALKRPLASADILVARNPSMILAASSKIGAVFEPEQVGSFIDFLVSKEKTNAQR